MVLSFLQGCLALAYVQPSTHTQTWYALDTINACDVSLAQFTSATATSRCAGITTDGAVRLQIVNEQYFAFRKLEEGKLQTWLQERNLPWFGGTVATLDPASMAKAYPYLRNGGVGQANAGASPSGAMPSPFAGLKLPKMPWDSE